MKRVVITGVGIVSCLGNNQAEVYQSLLNSKSGITFSEEYKEYNLKRPNEKYRFEFTTTSKSMQERLGVKKGD